MFKRILIATFGMALITVPAVTSQPDSRAELSGDVRRSEVHVDCLKHDQPQLCTRVVEELITELGHFNDAFNPPNLDGLTTFYHGRSFFETNRHVWLGA